MTLLALWWTVAAAAPLGPCADAPACTVRVATADAPPELAAALAGLGLKVGEPGPVAALTASGGDRAFEVAVQVLGDAVAVTARSLHRPKEVYGEGRARVVRTRSDLAARARQVALRNASLQALEDLGARIPEALGRGVRRLRFTLRVNGLESRAREVVAREVLPCLKGRLELLGAATSPSEAGGYLEEEVEYAPAALEPRDPLEWHVAWVRAALLGGPKAACPLAGGPLAAFTVRVSADALNRAVLVDFLR